MGSVVERINALMQLSKFFLFLSLSFKCVLNTGSQLPAEHVAMDALEKNILLKMKIVSQLLVCLILSCDCHVTCVAA